MVVTWALLSLLACGGFTPDPGTGETGDTDTTTDTTDTVDTEDTVEDTEDTVDDTEDTVEDTVDTEVDDDTDFQWDTSVPPEDTDVPATPTPTPTPQPSVDTRDGLWAGTFRMTSVAPVVQDSVCTGALVLTLDQGAATQVTTPSITCNWGLSLGPHSVSGWGRVTINISGRYANDPTKVNGDIIMEDTSLGFYRAERFIGTVTGDQLRFVFDNVSILGIGESANFVLTRN